MQKKDFEYELNPCFDEIVRLEHLQDAINDLNERKNFKFDLHGISSGHNQKKNHDIKTNVSKVKWSNLKNSIPIYRQFYTDELVEKVFGLYRDDFETYGYTQADITG